jgi:hypothetical protein
VLVDVRDQQQKQAASVAAWYGVKTDTSPAGLPRTSTGAWLRNSSGLPVYDVLLEWVIEDHLHRHKRLALVPPTSEAVFEAMPAVFDFEDQQRDSPADGAVEAAKMIALRLDPGRAPIQVRMSFRDSANRLWLRKATGELRKASGSVTRLRRLQSLRKG